MKMHSVEYLKKVCCVVCDFVVTETSRFQRTAHVHQLVLPMYEEWVK